MKRGSNDLFELIHSLTKSEKRYFKTFATRHVIGEGNIYSKLFDIIEKSSSYNKDEIIKQDKSIRSSQIRNQKKYLYELIMKSLDAFHSEKNAARKIQNLMNQAELLYEKQLYSQSATTLYQAKELALRHENFPALLEINDRERLLLFFEPKLNTKEFQKIYDNDLITLKKLENQKEYTRLNHEINIFERIRGKARSKQENLAILQITDTPLLKDVHSAHSFKAKSAFYKIKMQYFHSTGDLEMAIVNAQERVELMQAHPQFIRDEPLNYFWSLNVVLNLLHEYKNYKEAPKYISEIRNAQTKYRLKSNDALNFFIFRTLTSYEINYFIQTGQFEKGLTIIPGVVKQIEEFKNRITKVHKIELYYNIAYLYFGAGEFKKALEWINKLINDRTTDTALASYFIVPILNILIHIELGNEDLVSYAARSAQRFLQKRERLYKFESVVIDFVKRLTKNYSTEDLKREYEKFYLRLVNTLEDANEKRGLENFDFISWLESRIKKKSFASIVKEKAKHIQL